jgi:hypothetical protein
MKLRVIKAHKASFNYSVVFKKGDKVKVGHEDPDMPGWYWCENKNGVWSWIPEEYLDRAGAKGTITHDYDTTELTVDVGDVLGYAAEVMFWTLCRAHDGREGWVPTANLERVYSGRSQGLCT